MAHDSESAATKMKGFTSGRVLDDSLTDQEIDSILELFHESLFNDNGVLCEDGTCSYDERIQELQSMFADIKSDVLLLRMHRRLERITRKLQKKEREFGFLGQERNVF